MNRPIQYDPRRAIPPKTHAERQSEFDLVFGLILVLTMALSFVLVRFTLGG